MKHLVALAVVVAALSATATPASAAPELGVIAGEALCAGQHEAAATLASEAIRVAPERAEGYLVLGLALDRLGRYEEAAEAYRVVVRLGADRSRSLLLLGRALARAGDLEGALRAYDLVRQLPERTASL